MLDCSGFTDIVESKELLVTIQQFLFLIADVAELTELSGHCQYYRKAANWIDASLFNLF